MLPAYPLSVTEPEKDGNGRRAAWTLRKHKRPHTRTGMVVNKGKLW